MFVFLHKTDAFLEGLCGDMKKDIHIIRTHEEFFNLYNNKYTNTIFIASIVIIDLEFSLLDKSRNNKIIWRLGDWWKLPFPHNRNDILDSIIPNPHIIKLIEGPDISDFKKLYTGSSIFDNFTNDARAVGKIRLSREQFESVYIYTLWYVEESMHRPFNVAPIANVLLSGQISAEYPERLFLKNLNDKRFHILPFDGTRDTKKYVDNLNKYLCCFASCVYDFNQSTPLRKYFEILAAGSLLLCPLSHEALLNKLGLRRNIHCMLIDIDKKEEIDSILNYILDPSNRTQIDLIRKNGCSYARTNFTLENASKKFKEVALLMLAQ